MDTFSALFYRAFKIANDPDEHEDYRAKFDSYRGPYGTLFETVRVYNLREKKVTEATRVTTEAPLKGRGESDDSH